MSSIVMPSGFVDMNGIEMEYDGGWSWPTVQQIAGTAVAIIGFAISCAGYPVIGLPVMLIGIAAAMVGQGVMMHDSICGPSEASQ